MKHIYEWLDEPPKNEMEKLAKKWLDQFSKPAHMKRQKILDASVVTVKWKDKEWICSGCSTMGDVWLKKKKSDNFYDCRVSVDELSDWNVKSSTNPL